MIEAAWPWVRYQPGSALSRWFQEPLKRSNHLTARAAKRMPCGPAIFQNDSPPIVAPSEPPSFRDLSSRRETANNVEAIDTAALVRGLRICS
jgi:hypothetical protein